MKKLIRSNFVYDISGGERLVDLLEARGFFQLLFQKFPMSLHDINLFLELIRVSDLPARYLVPQAL